MNIKNKQLNIKHKMLFFTSVIALIPFISLTIVLTVYAGHFFKQTRQYNEYIQAQIASNISKVIKEMRRTISSFYDTDIIARLAALQSNYYTDETVKEVLKQITNAKYYFNYLDDLYLYVQSEDVILCEQGILDPETYYLINHDLIGYPCSQWLELLRSKDNKDIYMPYANGEQQYIDCFYNLLRPPYHISFSDSALMLVMSIPGDSFFAGAENISWLPHSSLYVFDENGTYLFGQSMNGTLAKTPDSIATLTASNKWLHTVISTSVSFETVSWTAISVVDNVYAFKTPICLILGAILALIICLSLLFITISSFGEFSYAPIRQLIILLNKQEKNIEYDSLIKSVQQVLLQNQHYAEDIAMQKRSYKNLLLSHLLNGSLSSNLAYTLENYNIVFPHKSFLVIAFSINKDSIRVQFTQHDLLTSMLESKFNETLTEYSAICYVTYDQAQFDCLCNLPESHAAMIDRFPELIQSISDSISMELDIQLNTGISNIHDSYSEIPAAYLEALEALTSSMKNNSVITLYREISLEEHQYLTQKQEMAIINYIQSGEFDDAITILKEVFNNFNLTTRNHHENILYDIICMYLKLPHLIDFSDDKTLLGLLTFPNFYAKLAHPDDLFGFIVEITQRICQYVQGKKNSQGHYLAKNAADYITQNYHDHNLSTDLLCQQMHCSISYLSKLFKSEFHLSIHEYIQAVRIDAAKKLLQTGMPISKVLLRVGYTNPRTFNRSFKSVENMSPTEYKKSLLN